MDELFQMPLVRIALHLLTVHLMFRIIAFLKAPTFYDESVYKMRIFRSPASQQQVKASPVRRKKSSSRARSTSPVLGKASAVENHDENEDPLILVTGSSGRIGSQVVKCLAAAGGFRIRAVDVVPCNAHRRCSAQQVEYIQINLELASDEECLQVLHGVRGVIHCAGCFILHKMMDTEIHNQITFLTAKMVALAKETPGCRAFVHSGSAFVCNNGTANLNAIPPNTPYVAKPSTFWVKCQIETEKLVIAAGDDPALLPEAKFFTCVNRFPFLYGPHDDLLLTLMVHHEMSCFPSNNDVRSELVYLKNAAHAHFCALQALLARNPSRAAKSVNVITQSPKGETCTNLEFWQRARRRLGVMRSFVILPTWIFYVVALGVQMVHQFFCGQIFPHSPVWNSNWAVLDHVSHDGTFLGQVEALHSIGYRPIYTNDSSFEDMAKDQRVLVKTRVLGHDPRKDIDWEPREMPGRTRNVLKTFLFAMSGPGVSWHETVLFATTFVAAVGFGVAISVKNGFSHAETFTCAFLAAWGMTSAVASIGPSSKRWFHLGGQLGMYMLILMFFDLVLSLLMFQAMFAGVEWGLVVGMMLTSSMLVLTVVVPLSQQRSYSVMICLAFGAAAFLECLPPVRSGMEWFLLLTVFKFLVCHSPRHEPYL